MNDVHFSQDKPSSAPTDFKPDLFNVMFATPHMQATLIELALNRQHDMLSFADKRCRADLALARKLRNADDLPKAVFAWAEFARTTIVDYAEQAHSASERGFKQAVETVRVAQDRLTRCATLPSREAG